LQALEGAVRFDHVVMFAQEFPRVKRHDRLVEQAGDCSGDRDLVSDEIIE
jgi:hypothetical protein